MQDPYTMLPMYTNINSYTQKGPLVCDFELVHHGAVPAWAGGAHPPPHPQGVC